MGKKFYLSPETVIRSQCRKKSPETGILKGLFDLMRENDNLYKDY